MNSSANDNSSPNEVSRRSFIKTASTVAGAGVFNIGNSSRADVPLPIPGSTFKGPFVFHCHTSEHEDLEMMFQFDPRAVGSLDPQPVQQFFP